jgi:Prophage tail length tape measure protein.
MAGSDTEIQVQLTADMAQLQAGMDAGAASVASATEAMQGSFATASAEMQAQSDAIVDANVAAYQKSVAAQNAAMTQMVTSAKVAAVEVEEVTAAVTVNSRVMGEVSTIASEALAGNFGRIRRSAAALANQSGLLQAAFTPLGLAIIATVAAAYELAKGYLDATARATEFSAALLTNGDAVGMTSDQLRTAADRLSAFSGNSKAADEIMQKLASSGKLTGQALVDAGTGASNIMRLTGESSAQAAKEVEKLGDNPAKAVVELNNKFHFLTVELYDQITALQKNGQQYEATELAAKAFADNTSERIEKLNQQMGFWESRWDGFKQRISDADHALQKFFDPTLAQSADTATHAWFQSQQMLNKAIKDGASASTIANLKDITESYRQNAVALRAKVRAEEDSAKAQGAASDKAAKTIAEIDAQEKFNKTLKDTSHLQEAIAEAKRRAEEIHKNDPESESIKGINFDASGAITGGEQWTATIAKLTKEYSNAGAEARKASQEAKKAASEQMNDLEMVRAGTAANTAERIQADAAILASATRLYGANSSQQKAALTQMLADEKAYNADVLKEQQKASKEVIDASIKRAGDDLKIRQEQVATQFALGQISKQQELAQLSAANEAEYALELDALKKYQATLDQKTKAYSDSVKEIEKLEANHKLAMVKSNDDVQKANLASWEKYLKPINGAFQQSINGMIQGTQTFKNGLDNILRSILASYVQLGIQTAIHWATTEAAKTTATTVGAAQRSIVESTAAAESKAADAATGKSQITSAAATGAAKAYQAIVGIPYVGPVLAPIAAGVAFAGIEAFSGMISSAQGGWERVPIDGMMTELHKDEMVLPAHVANPIRDMAKNGGGQGGGGQVHIHANDARSFKDMLRRNPGALAGALKQANRMGHLSGATR